MRETNARVVNSRSLAMLGVHYPTHDATEQMELITRQAPVDLDAEKAFLESKRRVIQGDPHLTDVARQQALAEIDRIAAQY